MHTHTYNTCNAALISTYRHDLRFHSRYRWPRTAPDSPTPALRIAPLERSKLRPQSCQHGAVCRHNIALPSASPRACLQRPGNFRGSCADFINPSQHALVPRLVGGYTLVSSPNYPLLHCGSTPPYVHTLSTANPYFHVIHHSTVTACADAAMGYLTRHNMAVCKCPSTIYGTVHQRIVEWFPSSLVVSIGGLNSGDQVAVSVHS